MFRFFFTIMLVLVAFVAGYYLGNEPVSHLTQTVNGLTIELDGMRERMASPAADAAPAEGAVKAADELRVINEGIAAFRAELADQKAMLEKTTASAAAQPDLAAATVAELTKARSQLEACEADKLDLKSRLSSGGVAAPAPSAAGAARPAEPPQFQYRPYDPSRR